MQGLALASRLQAVVDRGTVAGASVLVANKDDAHELIHCPVGFADIERKVPMAEDTLFWMASALSKPLTATMAMMLVDDGLLSLDTPIREYLHGFDARPHSEITVRHCLSHTAGLPFASALELNQPTGGVERFAGSRFRTFRMTGDDCVYDGLSLERAAASYARTPLSSPGSRFLYSNAGVNLVGRVIEVLSGDDFEHVVQSRLLGPLGMADTTLWPTEAQLCRLAKGYGASGGGMRGLCEVPFPQLTPPYSCRSRRGASPAGGFFSTARDAARLGRMILRGGELDGTRYLSPGAVAEMSTEHRTAAGEPIGYGLGWSIVRGGAEDAASGGFGHQGATGSGLFVHPPTGRTIVLMLHQDGGCDWREWWYDMRAALLRASDDDYAPAG